MKRNNIVFEKPKTSLSDNFLLHNSTNCNIFTSSNDSLKKLKLEESKNSSQFLGFINKQERIDNLTFRLKNQTWNIVLHNDILAKKWRENNSLNQKNENTDKIENQNNGTLINFSDIFNGSEDGLILEKKYIRKNRYKEVKLEENLV